MKYNLDFFTEYIGGKKLHKNYSKALDVYHHLSFHIDGFFEKPTNVSVEQENTLQNPYFVRLIDSRRPGETADIYKHRRTNYSPITRVPCSKVISSLSKIVKSSEWNIDYSNVDIPKTLSKENTLEYYCEKVYPGDDSIENWTYRMLIKWLLTDPNALICVMPLTWPEDNTEMLRPYAHIIQCKDVYTYKDNELTVFLSSYVNEYTDKDGNHYNGKIIIAVDKFSFTECKEIAEGKYEIIEHPHNIGEMPAWLMGGEAKTPDITQPFYESFIQAMIPSLDDAARDISDLQAEKIQHLFSTMWVIQSQNCPSCNGVGKVNRNGKQVACPDCEGGKRNPKTPYADMVVNLNNILSQDKNVPLPPAGYIVKPTDMVKIMMEIIKTEIHDALAAINMEFLADEPLNESGKSKEVDRDELNNFVHRIGYHVVENVVSPIYYFINEMRYGTIIPDKKVREKMLPKINVPQNFDIFKVRDAEDNLIKIAGSEVSGEVKDLAEMEFISERYQENPAVRDRLMVIHEHDPFRGTSLTDIMALEAAGLVMKVDVILSTYLSAFISQLLADDIGFLKLDFEEQRDILYQMADKKLQEMEAKLQQNQMNQISLMGGSASVTPEGMSGQITTDTLLGTKKQTDNPVADVPNKIDGKKTEEPRKQERDDLSRS